MSFLVYFHSKHHSAFCLCKRHVVTWLSVLFKAFTPTTTGKCKSASDCRLLLSVANMPIILINNSYKTVPYKNSCSVTCAHTHLKSCIEDDALIELLKSSVFDPRASISVFQWTKECFIWWVGTKNSLVISWVTTLDSALKPIGRRMYHPLEKNYSYDIWLKSTLHSIVNYAQHSDSIYCPIYTFLPFFFSTSFFTTYLGSWNLLLIYWPTYLFTLG